MQNDDFEWDDAKAAINLRAHSVWFEAARLAFKDVFAFEREDYREHYGEDRYTLVGMAEDRVLCVQQLPQRPHPHYLGTLCRTLRKAIIS